MFEFLINHFNGIVDKSAEQLYLVLVSVVVATMIGLPIAVLVYIKPRWQHPVLSVTAVLQTIPGLAMLAFFIPLLGIGQISAIAALVLYALLPLTRSTVTGLVNVDPAMLEAAQGIGMTRWQQLKWVELPLALPSVINGLRIATVMVMGLATLAAFIGAGGLGDFINQGLALNDNRLILCGAVPAAILALAMDGGLGLWHKLLKRRPYYPAQGKIQYAIAVVALSGLIVSGLWGIAPKGQDTIVIGSKKFQEQFVLARLMAMMIRHHTNLKVTTKLDLGTTSMVNQALTQGHIDLYPEYTGTAYKVIVKGQGVPNPEKMFHQLNQYYKSHFDCQWLPTFHFQNKQALAISRAFAQKHDLRTIEDLAQLQKPLTIAAPAEFIKRADAYQTLLNHYALRFQTVRQMDPGLLYQAINNKQVDVIMAFTTDGRLRQYHLKILKDNRQAFPSYHAAPVIRSNVLRQHPAIRKALEPLYQLLTPKVMKKLNYRMIVQKRSPRQVAKRFLVKHKLLE